MEGSSLTFRIQSDVQEVERALHRLPDVSSRAISRALNRTASSVRTQAKREISRMSGLRSSFVNTRMVVHKATRAKLYSDVEAKTKGVLVSQLPGARQTRTGISYSGGHKTVRIPHGFIHGTGGGSISYIRRHAASVGDNNPDKYGLVKRNPIRWLWAPNLVVIFGSDKLYSIMEKRAAEQWPKNISHEVHYALSRLK